MQTRVGWLLSFDPIIIKVSLWTHWYKKKLKTSKKKNQFFNCFKKIIPCPSANFFILIICVIPKNNSKKTGPALQLFLKSNNQPIFHLLSDHAVPPTPIPCTTSDAGLLSSACNQNICFGAPLVGSLLPLIWLSV
jgi:hypothetical protein